MPRRKHYWYPGAKLHVVARGNRKTDIFKQETDYKLYLDYLKEAIEYYDNKYHIMAYTLMTNHVHIQIETEDMDVSDLVKRVHSRYAWNFNKKYDYIGHLFQDRYKAELIQSDRYVLEASRYIHLNPVRANMVKNPSDYKWSSYNVYLGKTKDKLIQCDRILSYFIKDKSVDLYKTYVESEIQGSDPWEKISKGLAPGITW